MVTKKQELRITEFKIKEYELKEKLTKSALYKLIKLKKHRDSLRRDLEKNYEHWLFKSFQDEEDFVNWYLKYD